MLAPEILTDVTTLACNFWCANFFHGSSTLPCLALETSTSF